MYTVRNVQYTQPQLKAIELDGGIDQMTPEITTGPGRLRMSRNVWMIAGLPGYGRMTGCERFDGHASPYDATFIRLDLDEDVSATTAVGDSVTNGTATGEIIDYVDYEVFIPEDLWAPEDTDIVLDAVGGIVIYVASGTFTAGDTLTIGGTVNADVTRVFGVGLGAENYAEYYSWLAAAQEVARGDIAAPTGSGGIIGGTSFNGAQYCLRNASDGNTAKLWKSTSSGWSEITPTPTLGFDAGSVTLSAGQVIQDVILGVTITGGTSGHTGTVVGITETADAWDTAGGEGILFVSGATGNFTNDETISFTGGTVVADGTLTAVTFSPDGRAEFVVDNFTGYSGDEVALFADGVNQAVQIDTDDNTVLISTDLTTDTPKHCASHLNRWWLGFTGGILRCSDATYQTDFTSLTGGAHEIPSGDDISGLKRAIGNTLVVGGKNSIYLLQGTGVSDWTYNRFGENVGVVPYTMQGLRDVMFLSDFDISTLTTTNAFGDFQSGSLSEDIRAFLRDHRGTATASVVSRDKSHYRIFFEDMTCVCLCFERGGMRGATIIEYPFQVTSAWSSITDGVESIFVGADDGMVYQIDRGNSLDGESITGFMRFPFYSYGSPTNYKKFQKLMLELESPILLSTNTSITYLAEFDYASNNLPTSIERDLDIEGGGGRWDSTNTYESFIFDSSPASEATAYIDGVGKNMGLLINFDTIYDGPFTFNVALVEYVPLGRIT